MTCSPPRYDVDVAALDRRYRELQKQAHPDTVSSSASSPEVVKEAERASAALSLAHRAIKSKATRALLLLSDHGRVPLDEEAGTSRSATDMELLMSMMSAREALEDPLSSLSSLRSLRDSNREAMRRCESRIASLFQTIDARNSSFGDAAVAAELDEVESLVVELQYRTRLAGQADDVIDKRLRARANRMTE
jgi:molecular chaperone HscB